LNFYYPPIFTATGGSSSGGGADTLGPFILYEAASDLANSSILAPGSGISIITVGGQTFISATGSGGGGGGVVSVGLIAPADLFTVANSPVTSTGNLTLIKASQGSNLFYASPSGNSGVPTFRAIVSEDLMATLAAGGNIQFSQNGGVLTIAASSVSAASITGIITYAQGGTGLSATPANGQVPIGTGSGYALNTLTALAGIQIVNGSGIISIGATGALGGTVVSVGDFSPLFTVGTRTTTPAFSAVSQSANLGYFSPNGSSGNPLFRNVASGDFGNNLLDYTHGGTGLSASPTNGQLAIGNGAGYSLNALTPGVGIQIANGPGTITISSASAQGGTVTYVSSNNCSPLFNASFSNPTTNPTLSFTLSNAASGLVFASPSSGAPGPGSYRALVGTDLFAAFTQGSNITIAETGGTLTISSTNPGGTLTSFSASGMPTWFNVNVALPNSTPQLTFLPTGAQGDIAYFSAINTPANLSVGMATQVLGSNGLGLPTYLNLLQGFASATVSANLSISSKSYQCIDTSAANVVLTLNAASGMPEKIFWFKNDSVTGTNIATVQTNGTDTIEGSLTPKTILKLQILGIISDGVSNWRYLKPQVHSPTQGGTGSSTSPTDGQMPIGSTSSGIYVPGNIIPGPGIQVTNGPNSVTISNYSSAANVSSVSNIDGTLTISPTVGAVIASIANNVALPGAPTTTTPSSTDNSTKIATTAFTQTAINNAIAGVNSAASVSAATTQASDTSGLTYNNGVSGVGATLTGSTNTAIVWDGFTFTALGQRGLVKNDTQSPSGAFNGVYSVTQLQTGILPPILTRALDYDQPSDVNSTGAVPVINGTVNADTSWLLTTKVTTMGTDPLTYTQATLNPTTIQTTTLSNNKVWIGNSSNLAVGVTLTQDINTTNAGVVTIQPHVISNSKLRQSSGISVIGNSTGSTADVADISATGGTQLLGSNAGGTGLAFLNFVASTGLNLTNSGSTLTLSSTGGTVTSFSATGMPTWFNVNVVNPTTTPQLTFLPTGSKGDIAYFSAVNTPANLSIGAATQVVGANSSGLPIYLSLLQGFASVTVSANLSISSKSYQNIDASTVPVTLTLNAASSMPEKIFWFKNNTVTGTNAATLQTNGTDTIEGSFVSKTILKVQVFGIISDGVSNWRYLKPQIESPQSGGTGSSTAPTDGQIPIGSTSAQTYTPTNITPGPGIQVVNGPNSITLSSYASAAVISIGNCSPLFTTSIVNGAATYTLSNAPSGTGLFGPTSGAAAPPTYRAPVATDVYAALVSLLQAGSNITLTPNGSNQIAIASTASGGGGGSSVTWSTLSGAATAAANTKYAVDTSGGAFTCYFPSATPTDDSVIGFKLKNVGSNPALTFTIQPYTTIDGSSTAITSNRLNDYLEFHYSVASSAWFQTI